MVALAALALLAAPPDTTTAPPPTPAVEQSAPSSTPEAAPLAPPVVEASTPDPEPAPASAVDDRIALRDGGMMVGRIVAVQKGNYVTIVLAQSNETRTVSWALIDAYQVAGEAEQIASRGKPTIAELAAESDSIERQKNIGLGLAYGGYVSIPISLTLWTITAFTGDEDIFVSAAVSTGVTVGLLTAGGVLFFKSKQRRRELRKVQVSGHWLPGGGGLQLHGRF